MAGTMTMIEVAYGDLVPADDNVRDIIDDVDDLAASIEATGLQQPLKVQAIDDGKYLIVAGHRRHAAIGKLRDDGSTEWKRRKVPCVLNGQLDDGSRVAAMLVENLQRRDLNPIEEAHAFQRLNKEFGWKAGDIAGRIGRSADYVNVRLRLTKLPDVAQERVKDGSLPLASAVQLASLKDEETVTRLLKHGKVPGNYEISDAVNSEKVDDAIAKFKRKFDDLEIPYCDDRPPFYRHVFFEATDPKGMTLFEGNLPKTAKAYLQINRRTGDVSAIIARELTQKEIDKRLADEEKARVAARTEWQKEQEAKRTDAEATWSPEFKAFKQAEAEHHALVRQISEENAETERLALLRWAKAKPAKDAARLAMIEVVNQFSDYTALAKIFGIEATGWHELQAKVQEFISAKAENLVAAVMLSLEAEEIEEERNVVVASIERKPFPPAPVMGGAETATDDGTAAVEGDEQADD